MKALHKAGAAAALCAAMLFGAQCVRAADAGASGTSGDKAMSEALGRLQRGAGEAAADMAGALGEFAEQAKIAGAGMLNRLADCGPEGAKLLAESNRRLLESVNALRASHGASPVPADVLDGKPGDSALGRELAVQGRLLEWLEREAFPRGRDPR